MLNFYTQPVSLKPGFLRLIGVTKFKRSRFDVIPGGDRQTDRRTDRQSMTDGHFSTTNIPPRLFHGITRLCLNVDSIDEGVT